MSPVLASGQSGTSAFIPPPNPHPSPFYLSQKGQSLSKPCLHLPLVPLGLPVLSVWPSICLSEDSRRKSLEPHPAGCTCPVHCSPSLGGKCQLQNLGVTGCVLGVPEGWGMHVWKCIYRGQGQNRVRMLAGIYHDKKQYNRTGRGDTRQRQGDCLIFTIERYKAL